MHWETLGVAATVLIFLFRVSYQLGRLVKGVESLVATSDNHEERLIRVEQKASRCEGALRLFPGRVAEDGT